MWKKLSVVSTLFCQNSCLFVSFSFAGFVKSYFDSLYDEEIITEDSFKAWENSSDEEPGKGVTVTAASEFFRWLKSAPEETGEES